MQIKRTTVLVAGTALLTLVPAMMLAQDLRHTSQYFFFATAMASSGAWAVIFLCITLACTPIKNLLGWTWPLRLRRTLGLAAMGYTALHLVVYVIVGQHMRWDYIWVDAQLRLSRPPGWLAFVLLIPLTLTSTDTMVRRLGFARWKRLHRTIWVALFLGIVHVAWWKKRLSVTSNTRATTP